MRRCLPQKGKPERMLVDNTAQRFSNGYGVQLSYQEASTVLTIIRALYDAQTQAAEGSTDTSDYTTT